MRDAFLRNRVRSTAVKFFRDGVIESYTALLLEPYDLVLLDRDLMATPIAEVKAIQPQLTVCGGKIVYER